MAVCLGKHVASRIGLTAIITKAAFVHRKHAMCNTEQVHFVTLRYHNDQMVDPFPAARADADESESKSE